MTKKFKRNLKYTFKNKVLFMSFCHLNSGFDFRYSNFEFN